jgi:uncharacterized membrane protein YgaE (UPF0421/DUF939 family)
MSGNSTNTISKDTRIIFTLGHLFSLLGSMIGLFFGFYMFVIRPEINNNKENISSFKKEINEEVKVLTKEQTENMIEFNHTVSKLNSNIELLNQRFNDLHNARNSQNNTQGGFSMNDDFNSSNGGFIAEN